MFSGLEIVDMSKDNHNKSAFNYFNFFKKNPAFSLLTALSALFLLVGLLSLFFLSRRSNERVEIIPAESQEASGSGIYVDLSGAVMRPGLYHLKPGSRVNDLLVAGGGLSASADRDWFSKSVNLAQKLEDGIKFYIPYVGNGGAVDSGEVAGVYQGKVNINLASKTELETLSGVGPSMAQKIIDYRDKNGFFNKIEDLKQVSGIGDKTFENLKDYISVY